jgi:hypothetical protein
MLAKNCEEIVYSLDFEGRKGDMNYKVRHGTKQKYLETKINLQSLNMTATESST